MTENLLETALETPRRPRPEDVPEKFWDAERGELRVDALLKSYRELERRLSQRLARPAEDADEEEKRRWRELLDIPDSPDGYDITPPEGLGIDPEVNERLHRAGFSRAQVQLVYDLAAERLLPLIVEAAQQFEAERQIERLKQHFGGEERFRRIARQISAWGRQNLPAAVFEALSTTYEGVLAMERMMQGSEPAIAREAEIPPPESEEELRRMMRDPRYWRSREPEFVRRVTEGFRRLVGG
ncbi:MAG: hypothetical protein RMK64_11190 [Rhodovarius sp.]|nr:hypothetical protein [Rhodovarius sp.]MCX7933345.1 hypothetical protein [Rhodovarius sp.]MDW8315525.1 hypothetical protein [Rhodovarius sp.]